MADAIDQAALAFDADMGRAAPPRQTQQSPSEPKRPTESMFDNLGEFADNSEDTAGGDHLPSPTKSKKTPFEHQPDPEDDIDDDQGEDEDEAGGDDIEYETDDDGNILVDDDGNPIEKEKQGKKADDDDDDEKYTVMVEGEEVEVGLREALNGYVRQETFHRNMNKLNEGKQLVMQHAEQVMADREKLIAGLADLEEQVKALIPDEPDWDKLYAEDAGRARALEKQYRDVKAKLAEVKTKREAAEREKAEAEANDTVKFARSEFGKFANIAKWRDTKAMQKDLRSMKMTAEAVGFTPKEYGEVYDSRMLNILLKASKYDRIMAARPKPVNRQQGSNTNGAGRTRTAPKGIDRAQKRLTQTGSLDDAAAVFARIIK